MLTLDAVNATRERIAAWRDEGRGARIALAPTMGGLHAGHLALVRKAREVADRVVVSVYVNRLQFDRAEDYENYPGDLDDDLAALRTAGVDLAFVPSAEAMFPPGETAQPIELGSVAGTLEGAARPGHFAGVAAAVLRLFEVCAPDVAVFGEKDYQQLVLVRDLVARLKLNLQIIGVPTVRAADGLAHSSRNMRLSAGQRERASGLYRTLKALAARIEQGEREFTTLEREGELELEAHGLRPDYVAVRRRDDLSPATASAPLVVLGAAYADAVRLIDNVPVGAAG